MKPLVYQGPWTMILEDVPVPEVGPGQVRIDVKKVGICGSDVHGFIGKTGRRIPPMIMGHEFGGVVNALEANSIRFRDLRTEQPTLEDVFLALTGREMRN